MNRLPGAIFVVDIQKEHLAVSEAIKLHIPIIAMVDTKAIRMFQILLFHVMTIPPHHPVSYIPNSRCYN